MVLQHGKYGPCWSGVVKSKVVRCGPKRDMVPVVTRQAMHAFDCGTQDVRTVLPVVVVHGKAMIHKMQSLCMWHEKDSGII